MSYPVMPLGFLGSQGGDNDSYRIERSLRFNSADSAYLNRTPASAGNRKTWTWSGWVKRSALSGTIQLIESAGTATSTETTRLYFGFGGTENFIIGYGGADWRATTQLFRDISSWYHIVVAFDSGNATALDRIKLYVNGSQITSFSTTNTVTLNTDGALNNNIEHFVGRDSAANQYYFNGYLTEINFIDGQALTPSSFGETDAITGRWKAKAYSGTYGTNGFYLSFKNNANVSALGTDQAFSDGKKAENNFWTVNNFSVTAGAGNDSLVDSPTNYGTDTGVGGEVRGNYATWNALDSTASSRSNGNLDFSTPSSGWGTTRATIGLNSGKWYWEVTYVSGTDGFVGIMNQTDPITNYVGQSSTSYGYYTNGNKYNNTSPTSYGSSYTNNDVIGVALNLDAGSIVFYKNGVSQGTAYSSIPLTNTYLPAAGDGTGGAGASFIGNFGQRPFAYTAPAGFKALCTTNLPTPTIQKPSSYMDVVTYTGNGSTQTISGLGFMPDLIWCKSRSTARNHSLTDSVRGVDKQLYTNLTNSEGSQSNQITAFNSNGFSLGDNTSGVGSVNENTLTYVAWAWDEAPIAGMDIVAATMNISGSTTINHNLGVTPKFVITKNRSGTIDWNIYSASLGVNQYILLNSTAAATTSTGFWGTPTSTQFVFSSAFQNTGTYIAYLFAEVEGFSKFGSYTGNGSADGPFVWCGFRPRWVMYKNASSAVNWVILDAARSTINLANLSLYPDSSSQELNFNGCDILSNGFKLRSTDSPNNGNGNTIIFAAFAESPFKYARAR